MPLPSPPLPSPQYLRQLLDGRGLYNLQKHNEWSTIEDLAVFGALTSSAASASGSKGATVPSRLQRHFAVLQVPELEKPDLRAITSRLLQALLAVGGNKIDPPPGGGPKINKTDVPPSGGPKGTAESGAPPSGGLNGILSGSLEVYSRVRQALGTSDLPGRQHYFFSLATLESVFQVSLSPRSRSVLVLAPGQS